MQVSISLTMNVEAKPWRHMSNDWIQARYQSYRDKQIKQKSRELQILNAASAAPALFQRLKGQVLQDVKAYNSVFSQSVVDQHCHATLKELGSLGFSVTVQGSTVRVTMQEGTTIICADYSGVTKAADCLQAMYNDNQTPGYWHGDDEFVDEGRASQIILDPILCG
jgi:hypothetical protein